MTRITDEMVEAAAEELWPQGGTLDQHRKVRNALTAAMAYLDRPTLEKIAETVAGVIGPDVRYVHQGATERVQNAIIDRRANQIATAVLALIGGAS